MSETPTTITWDDFAKVDMRVGKIIRVEDHPKARKPAYKLWVDFGPLGVKTSSAQLTRRYRKEDLEGRLVVAVVNFPPRRIADFTSEVLVLGAMGPDNDVILLQPDQPTPLGWPIG